MSSEGPLHERFGRLFPAGSVLFNEGDPGHDMYVVHSGLVQLTRKLRGNDSLLANLGPGEFFGEMAIVNNRPRSATALALADTTALVIDQRTFEVMIRRNTEIAVRLVRKLANRLDQANAQIEVLLMRDLNHRVAHYLRRIAETMGVPDGAGLRVAITATDLSNRIDADRVQCEEALDRLAKARLIDHDRAGGTISISEVGRLDEFLQFLEMKERFGDTT
ncbi:MAG: Crp/Fnr family transcriptional regulator [Myxococcales bacterium]|nr:Crp/Fnr family transcriptional regulator [Myxococcales bacterium]